MIDNKAMVAKISKVPSHSDIPKGTCSQITAKKAADSGSAQASRLVSEALRYFRLSK